MKFDTPAGQNPIDQLKHVGKPIDRIDGKYKTTGTARYAYERHDMVANPAYGYVVGAAIAKGRISRLDLAAAKAAPGVLTIVTADTAGPLTKGNFNTAKLLGGPEIDHYHQAVALVVAETFEQARAAAALIVIDYARTAGRFDLAKELKDAPLHSEKGKPPVAKVGNFDAAFGTAPVKLDATYTTPDHSHAMMEPHATTAIWDGDKVTLYTSNQMIVMALEIAMDEMAEKLGMDPVAFRVANDTQVDPEKPERRFSQRQLIQCLEQGAERFGWSQRSAKPGQRRDGQWLVGMGVAAGFRNSMAMKSAARVALDKKGIVTVSTDMTDIGTGTYTIIAQTAAEMMGVDVDKVVVQLGDSDHPVSAGSGGQWGANNATAGVYAACVKLREAIAQKLGFNSADVRFEGGKVSSGNRSVSLTEAAGDGGLVAEDAIEYGDLDKKYQQSTFAGHFVEAAVHGLTGEVRIRRMLAVCAAGRILNPKSARSQVIGAMTMGAGAALMEELAVDTRFGFFVNHDLASYEVPVHADIPHQEVIFLDEVDPTSSPMKAKGVGELGLCGVGAAIANAIYNASGVRVRDYPVTLDKHLAQLPPVA